MGLFGPPNVKLLQAARNEKGLRKALKHKDVRIRMKAAAALCELQEPDGPEFLKATLKNPDETLALQAAACLADCGDKTGLQILIRSIEEKPTVYVAERLGRLQAAEATKSLFEALINWKNAHAWERGADWTLPRKLAEVIVAIEGLKILPRALGEELVLFELIRLHDDALIHETVRVLQGLDDATKRAATVSLGYVVDRATAPALFRNAFSVPVVEKLLQAREIQDELIREYPTFIDSADTRLAVVKIIASCPSEKSLEFLCNCATDPDLSVATKAIDSLVGSQSRFDEIDTTIKRLSEMFREPDIPMSTKLYLAQTLKGRWSPLSDPEKAFFALNENDVAALNLGPLAAPIFVCGLLHPPSSKKSLRALEIMLRTFPQEILEKELRKIVVVGSIVSETPEVGSDGADGLYWGIDRQSHSARGTQELAVKELKRRGIVV